MQLMYISSLEYINMLEIYIFFLIDFRFRLELYLIENSIYFVWYHEEN